MQPSPLYNSGPFPSPPKGTLYLSAVSTMRRVSSWPKVILKKPFVSNHWHYSFWYPVPLSGHNFLSSQHQSKSPLSQSSRPICGNGEQGQNFLPGSLGLLPLCKQFSHILNIFEGFFLQLLAFTKTELPTLPDSSYVETAHSPTLLPVTRPGDGAGCCWLQVTLVPSHPL